MKTADVLRSLEKGRLLELVGKLRPDFQLARANESPETLCTRFARSLGVSLGWRESLEQVLDQLQNDELRNCLTIQTWEVFDDSGDDLEVHVYRPTRLAELSGPALRRLILELADQEDVGTIEKVFEGRAWGAYFTEIESYTLLEDGTRQRADDELLGAEDLADLNVADARDDNLVMDIAQVTGLSPSAVEQRLDDAHGRTLLRNCFDAEWPHEASLDELAELTVADARARGLVSALAALTGMSPKGVVRRLNANHGRTLLTTCFEDHWPTGETVDAQSLERMNVAEALEQDVIADLAEITGMTVKGVRRRLNAAHGRTRLTTCFSDCWPDGDDDEPAIEELADMNVAEAQDRELIDLIGITTGMSPQGVQRRLNEVHGRTLVINCFWDRWPHEHPERDAAELGALTVADALRAGLASDVALVTGVSEQTAKRRLEAVHGKTLVRSCFDDRWPDTVERLAVLNAADARDRRLASTLAQLLGVSERLVEKRLKEAHGRTMLPRCFEREWPDGFTEDRPRRRKRVVKPETDSSDKRRPRKKRPVEPWDELRVVNERWELVARLGAGGFGTAFEARDLETNGPNVVLKFPRPEDPDTVIALKREYEVTRKLKHANICTYFHYEVDRAFKLPFLVMEFGGESIERALDAEAEQAFTPDAALGIVCDAAEALEHVHAQEQIHGDINPGNLLVLGKRGMLTDFGVAANIELRRQGDGGYTKIATSLHGYHRIYGAQDDPTTRRSDQYSLALVLCSMLEGRVFEGRYHFPGFKRLAPEQNAAIKRALSEKPADRFPSCRAFAQALRNGDGR